MDRDNDENEEGAEGDNNREDDDSVMNDNGFHNSVEQRRKCHG